MGFSGDTFAAVKRTNVNRDGSDLVTGVETGVVHNDVSFGIEGFDDELLVIYIESLVATWETQRIE